METRVRFLLFLYLFFLFFLNADNYFLVNVANIQTFLFCPGSFLLFSGIGASEYLKRIFADADDNDDGVLERDELSVAFDLMGYPLNNRQLELVLCVLDHDMSGLVDADEFSTILLNSMRFVAAVDKVGSQLKFCKGVQKSIQYVRQKTKTAKTAERAVRIFKRYVSWAHFWLLGFYFVISLSLSLSHSFFSSNYSLFLASRTSMEVKPWNLMSLKRR